jgi:hypothetical protein
MTTKPRRRTPPPVKYALIAGLVAVASFAIIEATGSMLTASNSGISGKFGAPPPQTVPAAAPQR